MQKYEPRQFEQKWQKHWQESGLASAAMEADKPKYYCLDMFPYPSGEGLHVGHWRPYVLTDTWARYQRMLGKQVLMPFGWDAFGLPAENRAIKQGIHPVESTKQAIVNMKRQLNEMGALFDWSREVDTSTPEYYRWTQWIFLQLYKMGLAYRNEALVNWCPVDQTVLANEQVIDGCCERCGSEVTKRSLKQWFFKITDYADELLDFEGIEWPERVKVMQKNWIGKSEGLLFEAPVKDTDITIQTFSAHYQACYADTFVVIAPDHPFLSKLLEGVENRDEILAFAERIVKKRLQRGYGEDKDPEGIFTGRYIIDPLGNGDLPIWIASYALADYGTGIVKCSAHDERDFRFAKKYNIPLKVALLPEDPELRTRVENFEVCFTDMEHGILTEPSEAAGMKAKEATPLIIEHVKKHGFARQQITYRLRDWLVSRQRYWGAPIPIIYCEEHGEVPVPEDQLPVELPHMADFQPGGESPLARNPDFVHTTCPICGSPANRETDTMDTFVDSSWYFLRYTDPHNTHEPFGREKADYWMPVDLYIGGIEHAILHLLYARFITKVLADANLLSYREPFKELFTNGMIYLHGKKMSKSKGNIVNPDELVARYGTDTLRGYELFIAPAEQDAEWNPNGVAGVYRFLNRVWQAVINSKDESLSESSVLTQQLIKDITEDMESYKFNTVVSSLMSYLNAVERKESSFSQSDKIIFLKLLAPVFPHIAEELWRFLGESESIFQSDWPVYDKNRLQSDTVTIVIQVNGKKKGVIESSADIDESSLRERIRVEYPLLDEQVRQSRVIYVPGRLINFVLE